MLTIRLERNAWQGGRGSQGIRRVGSEGLKRPQGESYGCRRYLQQRGDSEMGSWG